MFAKTMTSVAAVLLLCAQVAWAQGTASPPAKAPSTKTIPDDESAGAGAATTVPVPVGTWRGKTERLPLTGDFNEKIWGKNATSVRDVTLTVRAGAEATLTVSRKVVDARGRVVPGSSSVEQAEVTIGQARRGFASRLDHDVHVVRAERRYPGAPADTWPLENLRVNVVTFTDSRDTLEVRFEPADGQGSFSDVLTRGAARTRQ